MIPDHYIEIKVKRRIGYRRQGILFDLYAWFLLWQTYGWDFEAISKMNSELDAVMIYTGAVSWNKYIGKRVNFDDKDAKRWAEELTVKEMKQIGKVLMDSMKVMERMQAGAVKKK